MAEAIHPDVSEHVPTKKVSDRITVAKRAGVGRGLILVIDQLAVTFSGDPWDGFKMRFFGYRAPSMDEYRDNPDEEHKVAYDFVDGYLTGHEVAEIKEFVDEHKLR